MLDPRLLQLCDSAFPSGAFSQSFGLETAIQERTVTDAATTRAWIVAYCGDVLATLDARAIVLALGDTSVAELDALLGASVFATETRAAIERGDAHGMHALAVALGYRAIAAAPADAVCGYLSAAAAALAAVAARAVPLGQRDVGALLWSLREPIGTFAERALEVRTMDDLTMGAILCEIDAMRHAALDGRLFAS
jgi:urease accessory protein